MVNGLGEIATVARVEVLVPVRFTAAGVTVSPVEVTLSVRLYVPAVVGAVKMTLIVQLAPTARVPVVVQVPPDLEKGCGVPPPNVAVIPVVVATFPVLVTVSVCAPLVVPVNQLPKDSEFGETTRVRTTGTAVPVSVTGDPFTVTLAVMVAELVL